MIPVSTQVAVWVYNNRNAMVSFKTCKEAIDALGLDASYKNVCMTIRASSTITHHIDRSEEHKSYWGAGQRSVLVIDKMKWHLIIDGVMVADKSKPECDTIRVAKWVVENADRVLSSKTIGLAMDSIGIKGVVRGNLLHRIREDKKITMNKMSEYTERGGVYKIVSIENNNFEDIKPEAAITSLNILSVKW